MNAVTVIGSALLVSGAVCSTAAGILYEPPIQRYLEKLGGKPAHLLAIGGALDDYFNAKDLAKKWGHHPPFLKRYGQLLKISAALFSAGALMILLSMI